MNVEYFYEVRRNSCEIEDNFLTPTSETIPKIKFLAEINHNPSIGQTNGDYEIVKNEESDEEEEAAEAALAKEVNNALKKALPNTNGDFCLNYESNGKLQLSLSAEQIALKSQTVAAAAKINESITPATGTETEKEKETAARTLNNTKKATTKQKRCESTAREAKRGLIAATATTNAADTLIISTSTTTKTLYQPQETRGPRTTSATTHRPAINFTILPVGMTSRRTSSESNNGSSHNLPEIVLTSFEARSVQAKVDTMTATTTANTATMSTKAATVTFQRPTSALQKKATTTTAISPKNPTPTQFAAIPPPPETFRQRKLSNSNINNNNPQNEKAPSRKCRNIMSQKELDAIEPLCDTEESSASNSQFGSSTSPESLVDNVLSAASSVSVESSTSSSITNGNAKQGNEVSGVSLNDGKKINCSAAQSMQNIFSMAPIVREKDAWVNNTKPSTTITITSALNANTTAETQPNRALNSKSFDLKIPALLSPSLLSTAPPPPPTPSPSFVSLMPSMSSQLQLAGERAQNTLQLPQATQNATGEHYETHASSSRSPSPSQSIVIRVAPDATLFADDLKCLICMEVFRDPRTLNCLHSFCFQCLVDENFKQDSSIPFWSQPTSTGEETDWKAGAKSNYSLRSSSPEMSLHSVCETASSPMRQRRPSFNFMRKKSLDRILLKPKSEGKTTEYVSSTRLNNATEDRSRTILCKVCKFSTELPIGGIRQLPQNFILVRKIEDAKLKMGEDVISRVWCSLCFEETNATYHCITCTLNLCTLCKECHGRQRSTANHKIKNLVELRRARHQRQDLLADNSKFSVKCGMHPSFEVKAFCTSCLQLACADCLVLLHKGHKHEPITKAINSYLKIVRDCAEQTRPLCNYAEHSIERLNDIAKNINRKCDEIQSEVDAFMDKYFEALEVHRKTLTQQVKRARESKVDMILEQQLDLEKHTREAMEALRFSQELSDMASDVEILSFVNILLKRFEYCQQFKSPIDPKISDSLHFLHKIRAPFAKSQNGIPLFGIITMQTVEPSLCTLQWEGFSQLRLNKKVELLVLSRDANGLALCHGGLEINAFLKYKDSNARFLPVDISDHRDGTYGVAFTPDAQGTLVLTVTINDKPIKGNPFTFLVRSVRPHSGIYHCCAFCSGKGSKVVKCCCEGRMPGYAGCGHGHAGHPGRRHWSCCGNVLENSECTETNKLLNS